MLVLTREPSDSSHTINLHTSDGLIQVKVIQVVGQQVRIGIEAPDSVNIARAEIDDLVEQDDEFATR